MYLRVGHVVPDTEAEGPGRRFAVWVQGCPLRCPGCCNPELLRASGGTLRATEELARAIVATPGIEGVTFLGGEPMAQAGAVLQVARAVRRGGLSVMLFSGFSLAELRAGKRGGMRGDVRALLGAVDLLVDGPYERGRPEHKRRWIGSANQRMHFLTKRYSPDDPRFVQANTVEIRLGPGGLAVHGWPGASDAVLAGSRARARPEKLPEKP